MRSDTQTVQLRAPADAVFDFLADPNHLPLWVVGFCLAIRPDSDRWIVRTPHGELPVHFRLSRETGVVDHLMETAPGETAVAW